MICMEHVCPVQMKFCGIQEIILLTRPNAIINFCRECIIFVHEIFYFFRGRQVAATSISNLTMGHSTMDSNTSLQIKQPFGIYDPDVCDLDNMQHLCSASVLMI